MKFAVGTKVAFHDGQRGEIVAAYIGGCYEFLSTTGARFTVRENEISDAEIPPSPPKALPANAVGRLVRRVHYEHGRAQSVIDDAPIYLDRSEPRHSYNSRPAAA